MNEKLTNYILDWLKKSGLKPVNEITFIENFMQFISRENFDNLEFYFDGDGSYFGKQISINTYMSFGQNLLNFEICYNSNKISVYDGNNNGYWTPEYICLNKGDEYFIELQEKIKHLLIHFFGINYLIN